MTLNELRDYLSQQGCDFEIIKQEEPIIKTSDAAKYFDIDKAAPTFVMDTDQGLVAFIASSQRGRIDFKAIKQSLGFSKLSMADRIKIRESTGYEAGAIPLVGLSLPCIFDTMLLKEDCIYGGSGDVLHTLKISPNDVYRLNSVQWEIS